MYPSWRVGLLRKNLYIVGIIAYTLFHCIYTELNVSIVFMVHQQYLVSRHIIIIIFLIWKNLDVDGCENRITMDLFFQTTKSSLIVKLFSRYFLVCSFNMTSLGSR